jgi:molecular chaperone GrpE
MSGDTPEQIVQEGTPGAERAPGDGGSVRGGEGAAPREGAVPESPGVVSDGDAVSDVGVSEIEGDLDELVTVAAERDEYLALAQRTQADFENYRRRSARDSALAQERGVVKLARELLPALDNLDRALEAADQDDPLLQGVRLVRSELADALGRMGIESFSPAGETFDPSLHEAMASAPQPPPPDGAPSGTVVEVYQPGYRLGEDVIRPARVVVAA